MINSITITSILCCLILLLSNSAESFNLSCRTTPTCTSSNNSIIKFPFTIKGSPSGYSGFPGFELSCDASNNNDNNPILLHLPNSVNFTLLSIDYQSQTVHVNSPDDCLPRQLRDLPRIDDSTAFRIEGKLPVYSFFDCPKLTHITQSMTSVPCLGSKVYVYPALSPVNDVDLVSCTKMFDGPYREDHGLELSWSNPDCGRCYRKKGQCCVLKKGSSEPEAECSGVTDEKKVSPLKKAVIAGVILGSASIAALLYALYRAHRFDRNEEEEEDGKIAKKLAVVGLWCIQWNPVDRPSMKLAVQMLEGEGDDLTAPPNPVSSSSGGASRMAKSMMQLQELEIVPEMESTS
ncbi:RING-H2 finger protein ATL22 [Linum perenne]